MSGRALGNVLNISRCFSTYRLRQHKELPLHPGHHLLIICVCRTPGITQDGIAETLCLDKTTVAHRVAKLEQTGYVERRPLPGDARCRCVYPTGKAQQLYPQLHREFETFAEQLMRGLTEQEQAELIRLTEKVRANARQLLRQQRIPAAEKEQER